MRYLLFLLLIFTTACGKQIENPLNWPVQDFTAVNQQGDQVTLEQLKGKVWVADFIFTNCTTVCSPMTAHFASLQNKLKEEGLDVTLVSFSVDPERDTPDALKAFAANFNADLSNWHFLTGYSEEEIKQLSEQSFKSSLVFETGTDQVMHGTLFYLVDSSGVIMKTYSGTDAASQDQMIQDAKILVK